MMPFNSNKNRWFYKSIAFGVCLTSILLMQPAQSQEGGSLVPQGQWKISEFKGSNPEKDSYCALIQPYSEDIFLSLGRNVLGEYSIALDFKQGGLKPDKSYSVTLQPGPGQIRAYELLPTSPRAMVVRLGYDDSFFEAFKKSKHLKAEVDGKEYNFPFPNVVNGQEKLASCMTALKSGNTAQVADIAFQAQKVKSLNDAETPRPPVINVKPAEVVENKPNTVESVEKINKVEETVTKALKPEEVLVTREVSPPVPTPPAPSAKEAGSPEKSISIARVSRAVEDVPKQATAKATVKPKVSTVVDSIETTEVQKKQRDTLNRLKAENERLSNALKTDVKNPVRVAPDRTKEILSLQNQIDQLQSQLAVAQGDKGLSNSSLQQELTALQNENKKLKETVQTISARQQDIRKANQLKLEEEKEKLEAENNRKLVELQKQVEQAKSSKVARGAANIEVSDEMRKQLDNLKAENIRLSAALQGQESKLRAFDSKSPEAEVELNKVRNRIKELESENQKLLLDARKARGQLDSAVVDAGNETFRRIKEYKKKLEAAKADNLILSREIEQMRRVSEEDRLKSVSGDWTLEQATKRYNEAEREIKRLGILLEQQRVAGRQERQELEGMLFDPAVTDQKQRQKLIELETKLAEAESQLRQRGVRSALVPNNRGIYPQEERVYVGVAPAPVLAPEPVQNSLVRAAPAPVVEPSTSVTPVETSYSNTPVVKVPVSVEPVISAQTREQPYSSRTSAISVSSARRAVSPVVSAVPLSFDANNVQTLLNRAGLSSGAISKISANQFSWVSGGVKGLAKLAKGSSVRQFSEQYIAEQRQQCSGDFASLPSNSETSQIVATDIACIGASESSAASIIFTRQGNDLIAISHQTSADDMDRVIDIRDRILSSL